MYTLTDLHAKFDVTYATPSTQKQNSKSRHAILCGNGYAIKDHSVRSHDPTALFSQAQSHSLEPRLFLAARVNVLLVVRAVHVALFFHRLDRLLQSLCVCLLIPQSCLEAFLF